LAKRLVFKKYSKYAVYIYQLLAQLEWASAF